jgi:hypothetical protein
MGYFINLFKNLLIKQQLNQQSLSCNFEDILKQFDEPKKQKTKEEIVQDYTIKQMMAHYELEYLREQPANLFTGNQSFYDNVGNKFFDFVPCSVRPEVLYCSYGKN